LQGTKNRLEVKSAAGLWISGRPCYICTRSNLKKSISLIQSQCKLQQHIHVKADDNIYCRLERFIVDLTGLGANPIKRNIALKKD